MDLRPQVRTLWTDTHYPKEKDGPRIKMPITLGPGEIEDKTVGS
jgi:hypothetical protein